MKQEYCIISTPPQMFQLHSINFYIKNNGTNKV